MIVTEPAVLILITSGISALMSILVLYFMGRKAEKIESDTRIALDEYVQDSIKSAGQAVIDTIEGSLKEQLDPILKLNSQAMSIVGKAGAATNKLKMMERQVLEAVQGEMGISPDMIEEFSPALAETLRKYPELMPKAMQVFEKITGNDWDFQSGSTARARPHPLSNRMREE